MSNVKCQMSNVKRQNVKRQMSNVKSQMSNVKCQNVKCQMSNVKCQTSKVKCQMSKCQTSKCQNVKTSNVKCQMSNVKMSNIDCRREPTATRGIRAVAVADAKIKRLRAGKKEAATGPECKTMPLNSAPGLKYRTFIARKGTKRTKMDGKDGYRLRNG